MRKTDTDDGSKRKMNDLDKALACVERMRLRSKRAAAIARLGSKFLDVFVPDIHDALDIAKSRRRTAEQNGYETE